MELLASVYVLDHLGWAIVLMLIGCALVVLEVFIPSGGLISILSAVAFVGAIVIAFNRGPATGLLFTLTTAVAVPSMLTLGLKLLPMTPVGRTLLGELPTEEEVAPEDPRRALLGKVGIARTKMLPSGAVEIEGQMIDAVSQGQAIEPGQYVAVCEVRANRVVVRPAGKDQRPRQENPNDLLKRPIEELGLESLEDPLA